MRGRLGALRAHCPVGLLSERPQLLQELGPVIAVAALDARPAALDRLRGRAHHLGVSEPHMQGVRKGCQAAVPQLLVSFSNAGRSFYGRLRLVFPLVWVAEVLTASALAPRPMLR